MVSQTENIYWGDISLLNADLACLDLLLQNDQVWQYYFNLAGTELPR